MYTISIAREGKKDKKKIPGIERNRGKENMYPRLPLWGRRRRSIIAALIGGSIPRRYAFPAKNDISQAPSMRELSPKVTEGVPYKKIFSCKSADLQGYGLCFLFFQELRFLPLWEESSKEAHEGGERKISPPCDPPLCAPKVFSFGNPPPRMTPICPCS